MKTTGQRVRIPLREIAFARAGDKGDTSNVGVVPYDEADFDLVREQVTLERVRELFAPLVQGEITCYEFPGIKALNFVMTHALGGGVSRSLNMDLHGKAYASLMLRLEIEVDSKRAARTRPGQ